MATIERFGPTRRGGPVFRWLGEPLAIDLANTVMVVRGAEDDGPGVDPGEEVDLLAAPADLRRWLDGESDRLDGFEVDGERDIEAIRELRDAVRGLLIAVAEGVSLPERSLALVNAASAAAPISPQLDPSPGRGDRRPVRSDLTEARDPLTGLLGSLARSAIELLSTVPEGELQVCRAPSCGMLYLGRKRWCCSACGNRARAARHYRRHRAAAAAG